MVKNFGSKKFGEKAALQGLAKKLWQMLTCITNRQSKINNKMKQFQTIVSLTWPDHFLAYAGRYRL